jgi:hypothetical protein
MAVEALGQKVYPPPPGLDPSDPESIRAAMQDIPAGALVFVLLAWTVGSAAGGWVAARLAPRRPVLHGMIIGALLLAGGLANLVMIPHPLWFTIVGVAVFLPAACLGARLGARPAAAPEPR